jgi:hypothetical protein
MEIGRWLIDQGTDVNAKAKVDPDGFGGHTPLFNCVVSQAYLCGRQRDAAFARIFLDQDANPNPRACCASNDDLSRTSRCTNIAMLPRLPGANAFMARVDRGTPG